MQFHKPDVIVNPAAYTAVVKAEQDVDRAYAVNSRAPEVLAKEAKKLGSLLVHFSTDYMFDGNKADPYSEEVTANPQGVYGASKFAGEEAIQANCDRHIILRSSWVVGAHGGNFAKTMLRLATERDALSVVADQFGAPTSAALLADVSAHIVSQLVYNRASSRTSNPVSNSVSQQTYGLYNAAASGVTNWHEYACYVIERAKQKSEDGSVLIAGQKRLIRLQPENIRPIPSTEFPTPAKRPADSRLDTSKLRQAFGLTLPIWQDGVDHILDQIL